MLSVIIPAYKEPYLNKTIRSLLWNKKEDIEIIVVLDGAEQEVMEHHRVHVVKLPKQLGLRNAINTGARLARGEYIMKVDAHCKFGKDFDVHLRPGMGEVMVPRLYALDCQKWEEYGEPSDFQKLVIHPKYNKFHGQVVKKKVESISETLSFQGACWVMRREWFEKIGPLDESTFGPFEQEPVEISFKTWKNGGKLLLNTNTWYAHPVSAKRTHHTKRGYEIWAKVIEMYKEDYQKYVLGHALY